MFLRKRNSELKFNIFATVRYSRQFVPWLNLSELSLRYQLNFMCQIEVGQSKSECSADDETPKQRPWTLDRPDSWSFRFRLFRFEVTREARLKDSWRTAQEEWLGIEKKKTEFLLLDTSEDNNHTILSLEASWICAPSCFFLRPSPINPSEIPRGITSIVNQLFGFGSVMGSWTRIRPWSSENYIFHGFQIYVLR